MTPSELNDYRPFSLTDTAVRAFLNKLEESRQNALEEGEEPPEACVRVWVQSLGCDIYQYNIEIGEAKKDGDIVFAYDNITFYIDPTSAEFMKGSVIDVIHLSDTDGEAFEVDNPNRKKF